MATETRPTEGASPALAVAIVMGASGSGKSTIGALLAPRLRWEFEDGDWFHPASNVDKMHKGIPLTDDDARGTPCVLRLRQGRWHGHRQCG